MLSKSVPPSAAEWGTDTTLSLGLTVFRTQIPRSLTMTAQWLQRRRHASWPEGAAVGAVQHNV